MCPRSQTETKTKWDLRIIFLCVTLNKSLLFQEEIEGQKDTDGDQQQAEAAPSKKSQDSSAQNETTIQQKVCLSLFL
jgi:hypothetical protein